MSWWELCVVKCRHSPPHLSIKRQLIFVFPSPVMSGPTFVALSFGRHFWVLPHSPFFLAFPLLLYLIFSHPLPSRLFTRVASKTIYFTFFTHLYFQLSWVNFIKCNVTFQILWQPTQILHIFLTKWNGNKSLC